MSAALWRYLETPEVWEGSEQARKTEPVVLDPPPVNDPVEDAPMPTDYVPKALRRYSTRVSISTTSSSPLVPGSM